MLCAAAKYLRRRFGRDKSHLFHAQSLVYRPLRRRDCSSSAVFMARVGYARDRRRPFPYVSADALHDRVFDLSIFDRHGTERDASRFDNPRPMGIKGRGPIRSRRSGELGTPWTNPTILLPSRKKEQRPPSLVLEPCRSLKPAQSPRRPRQG